MVMIILATADDKICTRWSSSLEASSTSESAKSLSELHDQLSRHPHATVILHASLPGFGGLSDIKALIATFPYANLFVLADIPLEQEGVEMVRAGVLGYANTHLRKEILKEAVKVISLGEIWVSKRLLQWLVQHCGTPALDKMNTGSFMALETLTPGEQKVLRHLLDGDSNKQIAHKLNITERTVKAHLTSIYRKTGVQDRLHLALLVNQAGA